jgi:cation/acetate symporter
MTIGFVASGCSPCSTAAPRQEGPAGFLAQQVRSETGIGASGASGH